MQDFLDAFTNHAEREQAQNALKQLKMKEGKIDEYVAGFERLAHRAGINLDNPSNMHTFAQGLPGPLVETVLCLDDPQNYVQWREAAQRHQRIWLKIQIHKGSYGSTQPPNRGPPNRGGSQGGNPFGNFYWRRPNQGAQGSQGNRSQPARQHLPPHDPNAMDTSAAARKVLHSGLTFFFSLSTFPRSKLLTYSFPPSCDLFPLSPSCDPFHDSFLLLMTHSYYP